MKLPLFATACLLASFIPLKATTTIADRTARPLCSAWVDSVMNTLSQQEKVAQLFFPVVDPTKGESSRAVIKRYVATNGVGGLLFRRGSIADYVSMINYAQSQARVPVMMTLDGEWGLAMRIPDTPKFPYNMALGAISDTRLLYEYGAEVARECREMGIHVNFAPVADVNLNPANPVIGRRSFGENPRRVAADVVSYSRGMEQGGVITTAKHFPGHGDTSTDSHKTLPVVSHSLQFMTDNDLIPFAQYIDAGNSGIMVGHLSVPSLDPSGLPASLSYDITTLLLKQQMGFGGLVFTDALEMKGAVAGENNCVSAFKAGADILLSSLNPSADIQAMLLALKAGDIDAAEVDKRCRKVLAYKWAVGLNTRPLPLNINGMKERLNTRYAQGLIERLTAASVTVTGNKNNLLPLDVQQSVAVVNIGVPSDNGLTSVMSRHAPVSTWSSSSQPLSASQLHKILDSDIVVAAVYNDKAASVEQLKALASHPNLVVVAFMTPYKAMKFKTTLARATAMMMMYDDNEVAHRVAGDALFGAVTVSGRLPVSMPGVAALNEGVSYGSDRLSFSQFHVPDVPAWLADSVDIIARKAVRAGAFPGLQVMVVKDGKVVVDGNYGHVSSAAGASAVTSATLFDLASMSKAIGTLPGIMMTESEGLLNLDYPIHYYIEELSGTDKADITPAMLLFHESGMPASLNMYDAMFDPDSYSGSITSRRVRAPFTIRVARNTYGNANARLRRDITAAKPSGNFDTEAARGIWVGKETYDTLMHRIYDVPLKTKTTRYSCLNFCLLMDIEQRLTGQSHDRWVSERIFGPLGATTLCYNPLLHYPINQIAATENDRFLRKQTVQGYVHDELAAFSGGVQGNAGLFGSATDVAKVCQMLLNGGTYGGVKVLPTEIVKKYTTMQSGKSRRGLGFDRPDVNNPDRSPVPEEVPGTAYGHTGFTGTCFWVDPDNNLIYVFLSNRVNPSRENPAWNKQKARSHLHRLLYQ